MGDIEHEAGLVAAEGVMLCGDCGRYDLYSNHSHSQLWLAVRHGLDRVMA